MALFLNEAFIFLIHHVIIAFLFLSFVDTFEGISFKFCFCPGFPTASRIIANVSQLIQSFTAEDFLKISQLKFTRAAFVWKVVGMSHSFRAAPGLVDQQEYYPWNKITFLKFSFSLPAGLEATQRPFHVSCGFVVDKKQLISWLSLFVYSGVIQTAWWSRQNLLNTSVSLTHKTILFSPCLFILNTTYNK